MYLGKIVESGRAEEVFKKPKHPHAQALVSPIPGLHGTERIRLDGEPRSPIANRVSICWAMSEIDGGV